MICVPSPVAILVGKFSFIVEAPEIRADVSDMESGTDKTPDIGRLSQYGASIRIDGLQTGHEPGRAGPRQLSPIEIADSGMFSPFLIPSMAGTSRHHSSYIESIKSL